MAYSTRWSKDVAVKPAYVTDENEQQIKQLYGGGGGLSRDQAWQQYQDVYRTAGAGDLLEGDYAAEADREFGDWWKHATESGELQGVDNKGTGTSWADLLPDLTKRVSARVAERTPGASQPDSNAPSSQNTVASAWNSQAPAASTPTATPAMPTQTSARSNTLWEMLMAQAQQGKAVDRFDPTIRAQADAYAAQEERARRDYLADLAESEGPLANLRGEQRMASERMGQRVGGFEAELIGREISFRRQEIAQALAQMGSFLSEGERIELQRELAQLDAQLRRYGFDLQDSQFTQRLGLDAEDLATRYDLIRRGLL